MSEHVDDEDRDINYFVGREVKGSIVATATETKTNEPGGYVKVEQKFVFTNGGYYWKQFYRSKYKESKLRQAKEDREKKEALDQQKQNEEEEETVGNEEEEDESIDGDSAEEDQSSRTHDDTTTDEDVEEEELRPSPDKLAAITKMLNKLDSDDSQLNDSGASLGFELMEEAEESNRAEDDSGLLSSMNTLGNRSEGEGSDSYPAHDEDSDSDQASTKDSPLEPLGKQEDASMSVSENNGSDSMENSNADLPMEPTDKTEETAAATVSASEDQEDEELEPTENSEDVDPSEREDQEGPKEGSMDVSKLVPEEDGKSPRSKRRKHKSKERKSKSKASDPLSPEQSKRKSKSKRKLKKAETDHDDEEGQKKPHSMSKKKTGTKKPSSVRKKKKATDAHEDDGGDKKLRKKKKAGGGGDDHEEEKKPLSMSKKKKKKDRKSGSKKRESKRDVTLSDDETDSSIPRDSNRSEDKNATDVDEGEEDNQSKPIFMKIMGVWAARKNKTKYSTPLNTIGERDEGEESTKKPPSLRAMVDRLKAKTSADDPVPKKTAPARFENAQAKEINFSEPYKRPVYKKTKEEKKLIEDTVKENVAFKGLDTSQQQPLVDAFETKKFDEGATISKAGQPERFYSIVQSGQVDFYTEEGEQVGTAGVGEAFGDMALQGASSLPVSAIAAGVETVLLQIEDFHFRHIVRDEMVRSEEEKVKLLKTVPLFKDLDDIDLTLLSAAMTPHEFKKGENITKRFREMPFCIIQKGSVVATDKDMGPGQSIGDAALSGKEKPAKVNATAASDGLAFTIDTDSFKKVFGDFERVKRKHEDQKALCTVNTIRDSGLLESQLQDLVSQMTEKTFGKGEDIYVKDQMTKPIMYLVRTGKVKLTKADGSEEVILPGSFFGQEHLAINASGSRALLPTEIKPKSSATAVSQTSCGLLSLQDLAAVTGTTSQASQPQNHIGLKDLERHRLLGEGQYGNVWLVTNKKAEDPEPLALKVQQLRTRKNPDRSNAIRKESAVMRALQHQFIVKLLNVYKANVEISMLMSLAPGGELFDIIHRQNAEGYWISGMNEACAKFYSAVIADTLAFMHKQKFLYRDLKPENVLIDKDGYPVLTDFGFAKKVESGKTYTFCGTPNFVAPEVILQRGHDGAADNWSLGVLIFEMVDGDNPFWEEGMDNATLYDVICNSPYFPLPEHVTDTAEHLISRLLEKNPSKRLGSFREKDILEHAWFANVNMDKLRAKKIKAPKVPPPIEL